MTIRNLKIFVAVYQNNSITKAAQQLHLAQPSVSMAIAEMEHYYGVRLFERMSRRIYVTEAGKMFYDYAIHIISLFDEMEHKMMDWDSIGKLRIGSSITIGTYVLPTLIRKFNIQYPHTKVRLSIYNSNTIENYILDNHLDFAFIEGIPSHSQMKQIRFMSDELCLICGVDHPLADIDTPSLQDLADYDFLLREKGSSVRDFFDSIMMLNHMNIEPIWESVSTQAIVKAVSMGIGISVLPYLLVKKDLDEGIILRKEIKKISLTRDFSIIYHQNKYLSDSAKSFLSLCQNQTDLL